MDQPRLARFPHHAWLGYWERVRSDSTVLVMSRRQVAFYIGYMRYGHAAVRWVSRGRERRYDAPEGAVRFCPADGERHTLIASHNPGNAFYTLVIPKAQLEELAASEGVVCPVEWRHMLCPRDDVLRRCMASLSSPTLAGDGRWDGHKDEVARRLMLRTLELHGVDAPSWGFDTSGFDTRTLADLVDYIDEHLSPGPMLSDMGPLVGLSPSHFARKFRQSTGLSLHRFVNVRRIQASFPLLRASEIPLAHVAMDLGFASQSHFTRLFSEQTGMTPAKYRKQSKPVAVRGIVMANPSPPRVVHRGPA
jgi:AraC-like DNA-binding protein